MIGVSGLQSKMKGLNRQNLLGSRAFLAVFVWSVVLILSAPPQKMLWAALLCFLAAGVLYPSALLGLFRPRWLFLLGLVVLASAWAMSTGTDGVQLTFSSDGLVAGLQMALRAAVIFTAANGLSSSLDISALAALLERMGLRGLGFSVGVAMNLLPGIRQSITVTWHALWMRGGLRRKRWLAMQYFVITALAHAMRQAEEITLAAEARAYSPEKARMQPIPHGALDIPLMVGLFCVLLMILIL